MSNKNKKKISILVEARDYIKNDWGDQCRQELAFGCWGCLSTLVIRFIDAYLDELEQEP